MNKRLLIKYLIMYFPFVLGVVLFCFGTFNLFSSLLFFLGGYIAIKNTFDYRLIKRNKSSCSIKKDGVEIVNKSNNMVNKDIQRDVIKPKKVDDIVGIKSVRRHVKVRRRY